jgi:hypothetical protein
MRSSFRNIGLVGMSVGTFSRDSFDDQLKTQSSVPTNWSEQETFQILSAVITVLRLSTSMFLDQRELIKINCTKYVVWRPSCGQLTPDTPTHTPSTASPLLHFGWSVCGPVKKHKFHFEQLSTPLASAMNNNPISSDAEDREAFRQPQTETRWRMCYSNFFDAATH